MKSKSCTPSKRRRIEKLRIAEAAGTKSGEDIIYDGGEIVTSPAITFHDAAMKKGGRLKHIHAE
jgi:hypothetical protein